MSPSVDEVVTRGVLAPVALSARAERQWTNVFTATGPDGTFVDRLTSDGTGGTVALGDCDGWTNATAEDPDTEQPRRLNMGSSAHGGVMWTEASEFGCEQSAAIFCLGTDSPNPLVVEPVEGRVAFVTTPSFTSGAGQDAGDQLCQAEAGAQGLSGTFVAMLGTSTGSAASRLDLSGSPWRRVDGIPFVFAAADLPDQYAALTALNVQADGTVVATLEQDDRYAYTGGDFGALPTLEQACNDWTATTNLVRGLMGNPQGAYENAGGCCSGGCNLTRRIFCFEE
jgi:hypothetical protein